jgi:hypothetical protein
MRFRERMITQEQVYRVACSRGDDGAGVGDGSRLDLGLNGQAAGLETAPQNPFAACFWCFARWPGETCDWSEVAQWQIAAETYKQ